MEKIKNLPNHIAIIPDGNRRWAKVRGLDAWLGHKKATENIEKLYNVIFELNITNTSFWGSSEDNLEKRPSVEVKFLMNLFKKEFLKLSKNEKIHKNKVRINIFGRWKEQFPEDVKFSLNKAIEETKNYSNFFLNFFIAYSGTGEIVETVKKIVEKAKTKTVCKIDRDIIKNNLFTCNLPPVDFVIRTGGEPHLSDGFMMWDTANSQLYFSDKLWPDFSKEDLRKAIMDYSKRERRFGK